MSNSVKKVSEIGGTVTLRTTLLTGEEEHERYVSRLRWICYAIVRKQCQAILYHTTMAERLLATYRSRLALAKGAEPTECIAIERKLFAELYEAKGIADRRIDGLFSKLEKHSQRLESAAKKLSHEIKDEMLCYDPSGWANKDYIEPQFTFIEWNDLLSVIAMEEALFAINQGYCDLSEHIGRNAKEYAKPIKNYLGVFTDKGWSPDASEAEAMQKHKKSFEKFNIPALKSPKNIQMEEFKLVKKQIDEFIGPNFTNALKKATRRRDIVEHVYEDKERTISVNNIAALLRLYGYRDEDMRMGWMEKAVLPVFLIHAPDELFKEVFPISELYDDCNLTPFMEDNYYSKLIIPHEEQWFQTLLLLPYRDDLVGLNLHNVKIMEQMLTNALHVKSFDDAERVVKQREKDSQTEEDYVRQELLPELYLDYPELEDYLHGIADGDAELMKMLNL